MKLNELMKDLEEELLDMFDLSISMVDISMKYYFYAYHQYYDQLLRYEDKMNIYENTIDEHAVHIFALQQPFAFDLRKVVTSLKMNSDLERIGDLAYNIIKRAHGNIHNDYYHADPELVRNSFLLQNHQLVMKMLSETKDNFYDMDFEKAKNTLLIDLEIDENNRSLLRESLKQSSENPEQMNFYLNHMTISKDLERIADHCKNLILRILYITTGENFNHSNIMYE